MRSAVEINNFLRSLLDPDEFGNDVSEEVQEKARCLLAMHEMQNGPSHDEVLFDILEHQYGASIDDSIPASPWSAGRLAEQSAGISISPISMDEVDNISITTDNMSSVVHIPETLNDVISISSYNTDTITADNITLTASTLGEQFEVALDDCEGSTIEINTEEDE